MLNESDEESKKEQALSPRSSARKENMNSHSELPSSESHHIYSRISTAHERSVPTRLGSTQPTNSAISNPI